MGYFKVTMHVSIAFRVDYSFKLAILARILTSTNWNFGSSSQYMHCTYFYQLEFWGLIAILALILTSTN